MDVKTNDLKKLILYAVSALCSAYALLSGRCLDIRVGTASLKAPGALILFALASVGLFFWYRFLSGRGITAVKLRFSLLMAVFLGSWHFIGKIFYFSCPPDEVRQYPYYLASFAGLCIFYFTLIKALYRFLNTADFNGKAVTGMYTWLNVRTFRKAYIILLVFWLPHMLVKFPGGVCGDVAGQLSQCFYIYDTKSPLLHTLLLGTFVKFGRLIGSENLGLFLFTLTETLVIDAIYSYLICVMIKLGCRKWTVLAALAFLCLDAYVVFCIGDCIKDVYYTAFFMLFMLMAAQYVEAPDGFRGSKKQQLMMIAACMGVWLFRNNGKYVIVPMMLIFAVGEIRARRKTGRGWAKPVLCFMLCIVLPALANYTLASVTHAEKGPMAENLSLPFQQTARFVKNHGDEVTEEERIIIDRVLVYDELAEKYNPFISDPVKSAYRWWASRSDVLEYLTVWAKMFFREPQCYLGAFLEQNFYLFFPEHNNYLYFVNTRPCSAYTQFYSIYTPVCMEKIQQLYLKYIDVLHRLPVLRLFNNMAVDMILIFSMAVCVFSLRDRKQLLLYIPIFISSCVFLGPVIKYHARYVYPCIYSLPFLIGIYTARTDRNSAVRAKDKK